MIGQGQLGNCDYEVHPLHLHELPQIKVLQQIVYDDLQDKTILQPLSDDELRNILNGNGMMIGVFVEEQLIAMRALLHPPIDDPEHLGFDVEAVDLTRVLYQEVSIVHPAYRGYGLQKILARLIMTQVDEADYDWLCATVKPFNIASLKDKLVQNMKIRALKYKYGGKLRYVLAKPFTEILEVGDEVKVIAMQQVEEQQQALQDGFVGTAIEQCGEQWFVHYRK